MTANLVWQALIHKLQKWTPLCSLLKTRLFDLNYTTPSWVTHIPPINPVYKSEHPCLSTFSPFYPLPPNALTVTGHIPIKYIVLKVDTPFFDQKPADVFRKKHAAVFFVNFSKRLHISHTLFFCFFGKNDS